MSRKRVKAQALRVYITPDVIERVREKLKNAHNDRTRYGSLSGLVNALLTEWVNKHTPGTQDLSTL